MIEAACSGDSAAGGAKVLTYSELYLRPSALQDDSPRMRTQLAAAFDAHIDSNAEEDHEVATLMRRATGADLPSGAYGVYWGRFFERGELRDILDLITCVHRVLRGARREKWIADVQFVFDRQNMKYTVGEDGAVRLRVDEAFEAGRQSVVAALDFPRYGAAKAAFEAGYRLLSATAPDGKHAIRDVFEAVEIVFKLMFPQASRIGAPELGAHLKPLIEARYAADAPARQSALRLLEQLREWVAAAQFYRHGQGQEEPNQPPIELAVLLMSSGASHLRWLLELDPGR